MKIYFKSEFEIIETFLDINEDPIDLSTINFKIEYYTLGQNTFIVSKTGSTFVNCQIDETDSSKLIVIFKNHKLSAGTLQREITLFIGNALFESTQKVMFNPVSAIELVLKGGEQGTAESTVVYPVIMPLPSYYDIKDLADSTGLREEWSGKQDSLTADVDYLTPSTAGTTYEPKKQATDLYVSSGEKSTWNGKQDALTFSTNIETDKASTTKISAIKTFYDWAVGKFIDLTKIVTTWTATTLNTNIPSEKLVKDNLDLKADILPSTGATSALRALFIARGYDAVTGTYHCVYNTNTGYYEMNGLTDITEAEMSVIYNYSTSLHNSNLRSALSLVKYRTFYPLKYMQNNTYDISYICQGNNVLEAFFGLSINDNPPDISVMTYAFFGCVNLKIVNSLRVRYVTNATNAADAFNNCQKLEECYLNMVKVAFSFAWSPLLSLASLTYLVTNRANGTTRITITVHATVWAKLNDSVNYPTWNALLVDAVANQYINFASA